MKPAQAIIFDIDRTLSEDTSWLSLTRELGASPDEHLRIYEDYKTGVSDYRVAKNALLALWRASGNANKHFFQQVFDKLPLAPGALPAVQRAQARHRVCLITGSMDLYAETVARKLQVADWYANTTLQWDEQGNLQDMDYELDQGKRKLEQLSEYCAKHGITPDQCIVVGDGENDLPLFTATGRGVVVGNDIPETLQRAAWKAIASITDLPAIIEAAKK